MRIGIDLGGTKIVRFLRSGCHPVLPAAHGDSSGVRGESHLADRAFRIQSRRHKEDQLGSMRFAQLAQLRGEEVTAPQEGLFSRIRSAFRT